MICHKNQLNWYLYERNIAMIWAKQKKFEGNAPNCHDLFYDTWVLNEKNIITY